MADSLVDHGFNPGGDAGSAPKEVAGNDFRWRWVAVSVFTLASTLNYLDRQILASVAPAVMAEFHLSATQFGWILSVFSLAYTFSAPLAGLLLDRFGLNRGSGLAVGYWSLVAASTALTKNFFQLVAARVALAVGEAAGIPANGKAFGEYLPSRERSLGMAVSQIGLTSGSILAPLLVAWLAPPYGWRSPFLVAGLAGLSWIPLWSVTAKLIRPTEARGRAEIGNSHANTRAFSVADLLRDKRLIALVFSNILWMGGYTVWSNWTTIYLVRAHHETMVSAARWAWIPPLVSNLGGLLGGWLVMRLIRGGMNGLEARRRVVGFGALAGLVALLIPLAPNSATGMLLISLSYFCTMTGTVNIYSMPQDLYPFYRVGFAVAMVTASYGVLQTVISPVVGYLVGHYGFTPVCWLVALLPLGTFWTLRPVTDGRL